MRPFILLTLLTLTATAAADYGLAPGTRMPDFDLKDQNGTPRTLRDILGPNGANIVFFRSADW